MDDLFNRVARRRRQGQSGFTLIELLVVIAVLAVLAFIVIFNVTGVKNKGNAAACSTDVKSTQTAVDSYINDGGAAMAVQTLPNDNGAAPTGDWALLVPKYLHSEPNVTECATTAMAVQFANGADATQGYTVVGK